jgi:hypothetical protein
LPSAVAAEAGATAEHARCHLLLLQLQQALQPGMSVAIYCGSGASVDSSGIPYWLTHAKGAQGSAAKFKAKKAFRIPLKRRSVQEESPAGYRSDAASWTSRRQTHSSGQQQHTPPGYGQAHSACSGAW